MNDKTPISPAGRRAPAPWLWALLALGALLGVAITLAYTLAPGLIRSQILAACAQTLTRTPTLGRVTVNPLRFEVQLHDFRLTDIDSLEVAGFDRLGVRLNPFPLLRGAITLSDVTMIRPRGRVVLNPDGSLNWTALIKTMPADTTPAKPARDAPEFNLDRLVVADGGLDFTDRTRTPAYEEQLRPINFTLEHFSTRRNNQNGYSLEAVSPAGERLAWSGTFSLEPLQSQGTFSLRPLHAASIARLAGAYLPFDLAQGTVEFASQYALDGSTTPATFALSKLEVSARDVVLAEKGTALPLIQAASIEAREGKVDVLRRQMTLGTVRADSGSLFLYMQPDGHINYEAWARPSGPVDSTQLWTTRIPSLSASRWAVTLEDRRLSPPARIVVPACSVGVNDFSTEPGTVLPITASAALDGGGSARVSGTVTPSTSRSDLAVDMKGFDLRDLQPYVQIGARIVVTRGTLDARGTLATRGPAGPGPMLRYTGTVSSRNFITVDRKLSTDFLKWGRLEMKGLDYQFMPSSIGIDEIVMTQPYVRAVIAPDRTTNFDAVATTPDSMPPAFRPAPGAPPDSIPTRIDLITIRDGVMYFADLSLQPSFATGIQKLEGHVKGLSSAAASHADLLLDGQVDAYAPVKIFGTINPLTEDQHSDVTLDFKHIELTTFTPYAGKFMGYPIERGKLSLKLNYKIDGRIVDGQNKVLVEQLSLGRKTDSPDATKLPIKFAIALLKDKDGNIDLDIPVQGDLDDPKFSLWRIILKILLNLITKAVTSPFKLIGAMFGGGDDESLESIAFPYGSAHLTPPETRKLDQLGKGLNDRPALRLDVDEAMDATRDSVALANARFDQRLLNQRARDARRGATLDSVGIADLSRDEYVRLLTGAYRAAFGDPPRIDTKLLKGLKGAAKDSMTAVLDAQRLKEMEFKLRMTVKVEPAEMQLLARHRAETIKAWLVTQGQIAPERIFIVSTPDSVTSDSSAVHVRLALNAD